MKLTRVVVNSKRKEFVLQTRSKAQYAFPFVLLSVKPSPKDPLVKVYVDKEAGSDAFSYELKSGKGDTVPMEHVLDFNQDPEFMREKLLYDLTLKAQELIKKKKLSKRLLARRLETSPTQLYRLLDQTFYGKTIDQLVKLLAVLGTNVELTVYKKAA